MAPDQSLTLNAMAAEILRWQADGRLNAADSLVRIAEMLHNTGRLTDRLPEVYARRDCRVLDR
jgi:hypothetical protein